MRQAYELDGEVDYGDMFALYIVCRYRNRLWRKYNFGFLLL